MTDTLDVIACGQHLICSREDNGRRAAAILPHTLADENDRPTFADYMADLDARIELVAVVDRARELDALHRALVILYGRAKEHTIPIEVLA